MLVCRYLDGDRCGYGRVEHDEDGGHVVPVKYDHSVGRWIPCSGPARRLGEITLRPPAQPSKIVCVALNFAPAERATADVRRPAGAASVHVVLKPPSSLAAPGDVVAHPGPAWDVSYEAELAVVIGVPCWRVLPERAAEVVAGYTCANDITAYARVAVDDGAASAPPVPVWAKHFDGFTPLGPWLATDLDPTDVEIVCTVDGETRQRGTTGNLIIPVLDTVAAVSEHMTLLPGDVILTGTPPGSAPLSVGDTVEVSIAGIGVLRNAIDAPAEAPPTRRDMSRSGSPLRI